jgi:hypothetical protein
MSVVPASIRSTLQYELPQMNENDYSELGALVSN